MTGFGKNYSITNQKITVEIKSLNSKGLDLNVRMPLFTAKWNRFTDSNCLSTGKRKSGFSIFIESTAEQTTTKVNVPIVKAYINQLKDIYADADQTELMKMAVRMPDAMKIERDEIDENDWAQIKVVIEEGLNNIMTQKRRGSIVRKEFQLRIGNIRQYMTL
jgi:uncharacterized protein YicC (UPF0701 family)